MNKIQILICLTTLAACSPKVETQGYMKEGDIKSQVAVGQSMREDVREKLGSPSAQSSFGNETWYYISSRKETTGFFKPELVEQDVTRIEFGTDGRVASVQTFDKSQSREFDLVKRTTPTEGHQLGFMEQVLGNIGRFNKPGGSSGGFGSRGSGSRGGGGY
jgi:outer membrane protein assembly factor BamE (lipoprotein component of BamABCDE complex)